MSQENVEIVRGFFESIGHAGETPLGLMRRLAHEDVVYVEDPKWPGGDTYRGQEAVAECWSSYDEVMGEGGNRFCHGCPRRRRSDRRHRSCIGSNARERYPVDHIWGYTCRMEDGRLSYFRAYFNPGEALEAAGLET